MNALHFTLLPLNWSTSPAFCMVFCDIGLVAYTQSQGTLCYAQSFMYDAHDLELNFEHYGSIPPQII